MTTSDDSERTGDGDDHEPASLSSLSRSDLAAPYIRATETFTTWLVIGNIGGLALVFQGVISNSVEITKPLALICFAFVVGAISGALAKLRGARRLLQGGSPDGSLIFTIAVYVSFGCLLGAITAPLVMFMFFEPLDLRAAP